MTFLRYTIETICRPSLEGVWITIENYDAVFHMYINKCYIHIVILDPQHDPIPGVGQHQTSSQYVFIAIS